MIAYLKGKVLKKFEKSIILENQGIGYEVFLSQIILEKIKEKQDFESYIYHQVREDYSDLYGFNNSQELNFFKKLISISGIGPKVGLEMMNVDINKLTSAIINEDSSFICTIPGIGKKTAQRVILELKNKLEIDSQEVLEINTNNINEDVILALINLGYQRNQVIKKLRNLPKEIKTEEETITYFLKNA